MTLTTFGEKLQVNCEIELAAPPALVWKTLVDFPAYGQWNPFIVRIEGLLAPGERIVQLVSPPDGRDLRVHRRVELVRSEEELRWKGRYGLGLWLRGEQYFRLRPLAAGRTRLAVGENLCGPGVTGNHRTVLNITRGIALMNEALKRRLESARATRR